MTSTRSLLVLFMVAVSLRSPAVGKGRVEWQETATHRIKVKYEGEREVGRWAFPKNPMSQRGKVIISNGDQNTFCSLVENGDFDRAISVLTYNYDDVPLEEAWNSINCNPLRERTDLAGIDPLKWAVERTKVGGAYAAIIDMIQYFMDEPGRARLFSDRLFCKRSIETRCGRTCFRYTQRDTFEEIAYQRSKASKETRGALDQTEYWLREHLKMFNFNPSDHDPTQCPKHLLQRRK